MVIRLITTIHTYNALPSSIQVVLQSKRLTKGKRGSFNFASKCRKWRFREPNFQNFPGAYPDLPDSFASSFYGDQHWSTQRPMYPLLAEAAGL